MNFTKTSRLLLSAAVVVVLMGVISYFTATGKAVIGVDPVSVEAQRAAIAVNAFWWLVTCLIGSAIAHVAGLVLEKKHVCDQE